MAVKHNCYQLRRLHLHTLTIAVRLLHLHTSSTAVRRLSAPQHTLDNKQNSCCCRTCQVILFVHQYPQPYDGRQGVHALVCPAAAAPLGLAKVPKVGLCDESCLQDGLLQHTLNGGKLRQLPVGLEA